MSDTKYIIDCGLQFDCKLMQRYCVARSKKTGKMGSPLPGNFVIWREKNNEIRNGNHPTLEGRVFFKLFPEGVKAKILYPFMILNMHLKG